MFDVDDDDCEEINTQRYICRKIERESGDNRGTNKTEYRHDS